MTSREGQGNMTFTGTGKSLALLCSTLAWQKQFKSSTANATTKSNAIHTTSAAAPANPDTITLPPVETLTSGGGFIVEDTTTESTNCHLVMDASSANGRSVCPDKQKTPTIFYATRTHSQISQVLREYRKTSYRVRMAVLAARKHYCNNKNVCKKRNIDEEWQVNLDFDGSCWRIKLLSVPLILHMAAVLFQQASFERP